MTWNCSEEKKKKKIPSRRSEAEGTTRLNGLVCLPHHQNEKGRRQVSGSGSHFFNR